MTSVEISAVHRSAVEAADPIEWPARFERRHGRKPARAAYLQRRELCLCQCAADAATRYRCDVVDPDFYHIMATPE